MARWKLTASHYLKVPGTEWEYKEVTSNGKSIRKIYEVPLLLNVNDPSDYNYPDAIIVCYEGTGQPKDIAFLGDPTPDMEPLDDEAQAISDAMRPRWTHPIESLPVSSQSLVPEAEIRAAARQEPKVARRL